jgi:hypothetical protein
LPGFLFSGSERRKLQSARSRSFSWFASVLSSDLRGDGEVALHDLLYDDGDDDDDEDDDEACGGGGDGGDAAMEENLAAQEKNLGNGGGNDREEQGNQAI